MQLVVEDVLDELVKNNFEFPKLKCSTTGKGILILHEEYDMVTMMRKNMNVFAHVDDGALGFNSRDDLIMCSKIACMVMAKWGLTAHVGCDGKNIRLI